MKLEELDWEKEVEKYLNDNEWNGFGELAKPVVAAKIAKREKREPKERQAHKELEAFRAHKKRKECCEDRNPFKHSCWNPCKDRHWPVCDDCQCDDCKKDHWKPCEDHKDPCIDHWKPCEDQKDPCIDHWKPCKEHKDPYKDRKPC